LERAIGARRQGGGSRTLSDTYASRGAYFVVGSTTGLNQFRDEMIICCIGESSTWAEWRSSRRRALRRLLRRGTTEVCGEFAAERHVGLLSGLLVYLGVVSVGLSANPCYPEDPRISIVPETKEVVIAGRPGSDLSLTGQITLLSTQAVPELIFRPTDLRQEIGTLTIARTQIQIIPSNISLRADTPQDVVFKIGNLKWPGEYLGSIDFLLPQHGTTSAIHVALKLRVDETPKLSVRAGSERIKVQLANCSWLGCLLRRKEKVNPMENYSFPVDNGSLLPFSLIGGASAVGDTHHRSTGDSIRLSLPTPFPSTPIVDIPFTVASGDLMPDHYVGDVQLRIAGKDDPIKIPLELNVRTGPVLPILILVVGILFGRFIKYMKDKGTPQSDLLRQLLRMQTRAAQDPSELGLLQHMLQQVRLDIDQMRLDIAKSELSIIENRLTLLARLRFLETLLTPRAADPGVTLVLANIAAARNQISLGADPTATANQIETEVQNLAPPAGIANEAVRAMEVAAATSVRGAASFATALPAGGPPVSPFRRAVAMVTGHPDALRTDITVWFLRPLAWILLITLLTVTGFIQLYLKNPIFGSDAPSDYFGLLVWAAGSDVAGRTLSNFRGS
jgi:hypothetical protein